MSTNTEGNGFVEWKEEFVSQERGNRVVHYYLKDSAGESFLAVIGTERSLRHMVYVASEEFVKVHGSEKSNAASFKWRSRREVVDWLTSLLSKQHGLQDHSKSPTNHFTQNSGFPTGFEVPGRYAPNRMALFGKNVKQRDIVWSGTPWSCGKQLKHYQAFCRNGTTIPIHSFVFVMAKEENHYLAYLEDMYEDRKGQKKVKVRWFHHNQEVIGVVPMPARHPREVFITPYSQVISAECVDGLASVLTPEHFDKCLEALPDASLTSIHFCCRQFRNNALNPFNLNKLRGYFDQALLSCLDLRVLSNSKLAPHSSDGEDGEELSHGGTPKRGSKKSRSSKSRQKFNMAHLGVRFSSRGSQITACGVAYQNLRFGLPGRRPLAVKYVGSEHSVASPFKVGDKIELLCQDSGIRGCWFRCMILEISRKQLKVQYDDVLDEDGCGNLEEWIPAFRSAAPDKLGMRSVGRPTIRPCRPHMKLNDGAIEIGIAVDAWWNDGWWEGVVTGLESGDLLQVYFPGEDVFTNLQRENLRVSMDWLGNNWVDIRVKQDILSAISAVSPGTKASASTIMTKGVESGGSAMSDRGAPPNSRNVVDEKDKQAVVELPQTEATPEGLKFINWMMQQQLPKNGSEVGRDIDDMDGDGVNDGDVDVGVDEHEKSEMEIDAVCAGKTCEVAIA